LNKEAFYFSIHPLLTIYHKVTRITTCGYHEK